MYEYDTLHNLCLKLRVLVEISLSNEPFQFKTFSVIHGYYIYMFV